MGTSKETKPKAKSILSKAKHSNPSKGKANATGTGNKVPVILVLAQLMNVSNERPLRKLVSQLSGYPERSLATTLLNHKKKDGTVEYDATTVWLTEKGLQVAKTKYGSAVEQSFDTSTLHEQVIGQHKITGAKLAIVTFLMQDHNSGKSEDQIMEHIHCTNKKSFGTYLSALSSANLVERVVEDGIKKLKLVKDTWYPFE